MQINGSGASVGVNLMPFCRLADVQLLIDQHQTHEPLHALLNPLKTFIAQIPCYFAKP